MNKQMTKQIKVHRKKAESNLNIYLKQQEKQLQSCQDPLFQTGKRFFQKNGQSNAISLVNFYEDRTNNLLAHRDLNINKNSQIQKVQGSNNSTTHFYEPKIKQLEQMFQKQRQHLIQHREFLVSEVRKCTTKIANYKNKINGYKNANEQLKRANSALKKQNSQLNQYIIQLIGKMEVMLAHQMEQMDTMNNTLQYNQTATNIKCFNIQNLSRIKQQEENRDAEINQRSMSLNSNKKSLGQYNEYDLQEDKQILSPCLKISHCEQVNQKCLEQMNDKFEALMYEYIRTKDYHVRKQSIELAKQIRKMKKQMQKLQKNTENTMVQSQVIEHFEKIKSAKDNKLVQNTQNSVVNSSIIFSEENLNHKNNFLPLNSSISEFPIFENGNQYIDAHYLPIKGQSPFTKKSLSNFSKFQTQGKKGHSNKKSNLT